jgi:hypothetical protein
MIHEQAHSGMMQQHDMLTMEVWNALSEEQKKILLKRMLEGKILMKEGMIKHIQFKLETMKMVKNMIDKC